MRVVNTSSYKKAITKWLLVSSFGTECGNSTVMIILRTSIQGTLIKQYSLFSHGFTILTLEEILI